MTENTNRVAIITGASKGIGKALALRLAKDGLAVVVNYASSQSAADDVVREIETAGGRAIAVKADVGTSAGITALFDAAEKSFGGIDILVNNAGIMKLSPLTEMDDAEFDRHVTINLTGTFYGIREAGKRLREGGRIINFSSSVVGMYGPGYGPYAASKAGVAPGPVETELFMTGKSEELVQNIIRNIPLGRLGQPDDIASVVSFLASAESGWINGQVLRANGGMI